MQSQAAQKDAKSNYHKEQYDFAVRLEQTDPAAAVEWYKELAKQWYAPAQTSLGFCLVEGRGVEKDEIEGVFWFKMAAVVGSTVAQHNLARCFAHGIGEKASLEDAIKWYRLAAAKGFIHSQYNLGLTLMRSACNNINEKEAQEKEAAYWFRAAAERGDAGAQRALAKCFRFGNGVTANEEEAKLWEAKANATEQKAASKESVASKKNMTASIFQSLDLTRDLDLPIVEEMKESKTISEQKKLAKAFQNITDVIDGKIRSTLSPNARSDMRKAIEAYQAAETLAELSVTEDILKKMVTHIPDPISDSGQLLNFYQVMLSSTKDIERGHRMMTVSPLPLSMDVDGLEFDDVSMRLRSPRSLRG